jgi:hypothetical protein
LQKLTRVGRIKISWDGRKNHGSCLSFSFVKVDGFLEITVENHIDKREKASFTQREREREEKERERERGKPPQCFFFSLKKIY